MLAPDAAIALFESEQPKNLDCHLDAALLRMQSHRASAALEGIEAVLEQEPTLARAHLLAALALFELERFAPAVRAIASAARLAPEYASSVDLAHGAARMAVHSWRRKLEAEDLTAEGAFELGRVRAQEGDYVRALAAYEVALCTAQTPLLHTAVGVALRILGRRQEAIEQHERALALDSNFALAHNNLAAVFGDLNNVQATRYHADRALELDCTAGSAQVSLAGVLLVAERYAEALTALVAAERANADLLPEVVSLRVVAHLGRSDLDAAEHDLARATGHKRAGRVLQLELASACVHRAWGRHKLALSALARLWSLAL